MSALGAIGYTSGSQRARVVTEKWGEHNLFCPNCSSTNLSRLSHNTKASDFICPHCKLFFQLKGQKTRLGNSITDGSYSAMMHAIQKDETPNFYFMHYDLESWSVQDLLLVPSFAFPTSAIIERPPLAITARRAGWIGCNIALNRIPAQARILVVKNGQVASPSEVREKFHRVKPIKEIPAKLRGWALDVLNVVQRLGKAEFSNADVYAFALELAKLHLENHHIEDKIRQQLQKLRDFNLLIHADRNRWRIPD